ncbi:MAG: cyclic nucleotide-binding domain-containing protein [Rhodospirillaceae bacterium]
MSIADDLAKTELFQDLDSVALQKIAAIAKKTEFDEGDTLYQFGDDASDLYFSQKGRIRFSLGVSSRPDRSGAIIDPGHVFGWAALLPENPRRVATAMRVWTQPWTPLPTR